MLSLAVGNAEGATLGVISVATMGGKDGDGAAEGTPVGTADEVIVG